MDEVEKLIEQLKSEDIDAKRIAAVRLMEIKGKRAVSALIEALKDENGDVRRSAAWALREIGDVSAVPVLIRALKDASKNVRFWAVVALREFGDASAVPALVEALKDGDIGGRGNVAEALEKIVEKCKTVEDLDEIERGIDKGSAALRKGRVDKSVLIDAQIEVAKLTSRIAKRKDELAPKRDLLLDGKPKPPKKERGVYRTLRVKNR